LFVFWAAGLVLAPAAASSICDPNELDELEEVEAPEERPEPVEEEGVELFEPLEDLPDPERPTMREGSPATSV